VQVAVDATELLAGFDHPGGAPAHRHVPVAPALHVRRPLPADPDHGLDGVGRAEGARQRGWHPQPQHRQGLGQPFAQAGGDPRVGLVQLAGQGLELRLGEQSTAGVVGRAHLGADRPTQVLRELVLHVPDLVQLAPGDDRVVKDVHDGLA